MHWFLHKNSFLVGRGGFEARPPFTALYFKGIQDYVATVRQAFLNLILYIFYWFNSKNLHLISHETWTIIQNRYNVLF